MAGRDYTKELNSVVEDILYEYTLDTFEEYWELSREVLEDMPVRRFFVRADVGYANVAILTDALVVDIEGEDEDESGNFTITPIKSIESVSFHKGPVSTIPESSDAQIVLLMSVIGTDYTGPYWMADTDQEREYLILFGKALIEAIAAMK